MPTLVEVVLPHMSQTFAVTQPNNFGDETLLDGRVVSAFVFPLAAIAQLLSSTFVASTALTKGQQTVEQHICDHCRSLMLTWRNSPC